MLNTKTGNHFYSAKQINANLFKNNATYIIFANK